MKLHPPADADALVGSGDIAVERHRNVESELCHSDVLRLRHFEKRLHRFPIPGRRHNGKLLFNVGVGEFGSPIPVGAVEIDLLVQNAKPLLARRQTFQSCDCCPGQSMR